MLANRIAVYQYVKDRFKHNTYMHSILAWNHLGENAISQNNLRPVTWNNIHGDNRFWLPITDNAGGIRLCILFLCLCLIESWEHKVSKGLAYLPLKYRIPLAIRSSSWTSSGLISLISLANSVRKALEFSKSSRLVARDGVLRKWADPCFKIRKSHVYFTIHTLKHAAKWLEKQIYTNSYEVLFHTWNM